MSDFESPRKPFESLTDGELDDLINRAEKAIFEGEIEAIESGEATPDELAAEWQKLREYYEYLISKFLTSSRSDGFIPRPALPIRREESSLRGDLKKASLAKDAFYP